jgi:two-component system LytT family response regulator
MSDSQYFLKVVIIDDSDSDRLLLKSFLKNYPEIKIVHEAGNGLDGLNCITQSDPDLVFLDINMPDIDGLEMLSRCSDRRFEVVIISGYKKYALNAIRHKVADYFIKPICAADISRLILNLKKEFAIRNSGFVRRDDSEIRNDHRRTTIGLPTQDGFCFVKTDEIVKCSANGNYTEVTLENRRIILVSRTLKEFENLLDESTFIRIHNSSIINVGYLRKYVRGDGGYVVLNDDSMIQVARNRKEKFLNKLVTI